MAINKIKISGAAVFDYIWCNNGRLTSSEISFVNNINNEPIWAPETSLLVNFNQSLLAGNITSGDSPLTSWKIYRKKDDDSNLELAATIETPDMSFIDYAVCNNSEYTYSFFAESENYISAPIESPTIKTNWDCWHIFSVDSTEHDNEYTYYEGFVFEINLEAGSINNNLQSNILQNFTPYSKVQKSRTNQYGGTLKAVLGYVDCTSGNIVDSLKIEGRLKLFTTDHRKKFLRDTQGHLWEVEITSPLSIQHMGGMQNYAYDAQIGWLEVAPASNIVITNLKR